MAHRLPGGDCRSQARREPDSRLERVPPNRRTKQQQESLHLQGNLAVRHDIGHGRKYVVTGDICSNDNRFKLWIDDWGALQRLLIYAGTCGAASSFLTPPGGGCFLLRRDGRTYKLVTSSVRQQHETFSSCANGPRRAARAPASDGAIVIKKQVVFEQ